ncbi:MAG TPA: DNA/RNA non-specific endonuclease [Gemmatimonadaceae bacterium]|nr:DNA/RNA non-specific endonuclease [Gemmatimonadaceae bacterium]
MHLRSSSAALVGLFLAFVSCNGDGTVSPVEPYAAPRSVAAQSLPPVRISEIHYDNSGADEGEAIEISGPAGTDLTRWQLVLYNGNGGAAYNTRALSGRIPATCSPRGVVVLTYPPDGIQNGAPDGMALVSAAGTVVEFLSYEGTFTAVGGAADGLASTDIGVEESGTTPIGHSLQRSGSGLWTGPSANSFGECNDHEEPPPAGPIATITITPGDATILVGATRQYTAVAVDADGTPVDEALAWSSGSPDVASVDADGLGNALATGLAAGDATIIATASNGVTGTATLRVEAELPPEPPPPVRFSEIHYDNVGTDTGEAIEIEGPAGTDLAGWSVILYNGNGGASYSTRMLDGTIPVTCGARGVVVLTYPQDGIQNGSPDGMALVAPGGVVVEFLSYEGTFTATNGPASGMMSADIGVAQASSTPIGQSLQRDGTGAWFGPASSTFGSCNDSGEPPEPGGHSISFSGRSASEPPLPVGFQDQLFATVRDGSGSVVDVAVTWSSESPEIAAIDDRGVMTALAAGTAIVRATAVEGIATATFSLPTRVATASTTAAYAGNAEFGEPADADPGDDFIIRRPQYTASYNQMRGTPNWVSYNLEATHFGDEDRCDCFTFDPALPAAFERYTTADYTGAGAFAGYGIDRGHLARSFDRTSGSLDNASTFYFTNIIPQAADLNQGPWAVMENHLGDLARHNDREVYMIAGVAGSRGTVKDEGRITIPASVWKVAVIMPRDHGLGPITSYRDLEAIAVIMPNEPGVRNVAWETYRTTVDAVEELSGYDLLALLPDHIEIAIESGTHPPAAAHDGPYESLEGSLVAMSAAGSSDLDGDPLVHHWSFGDGGVASGVTASHTYSRNGAYTVRLIVSDPLGLADTTTTTATVANVAPIIAPFAGAELLPGETYIIDGSFTDPGADAWTATVDYGDGSGVQPLALADKSFALAHTYLAPGTFTVTVSIDDGDDTSARSSVVTVLSPVAGIDLVIAMVERLVAEGRIGTGIGTSLTAKLLAAKSSLERGNLTPARAQLAAVLNQVVALGRAGVIPAADADALRTLLARAMEAL